MPQAQYMYWVGKLYDMRNELDFGLGSIGYFTWYECCCATLSQ